MKAFALFRLPKGKEIYFLEGSYQEVLASKEHQSKFGFIVSEFGLNQPLLILEGAPKEISNEQIMAMSPLFSGFEPIENKDIKNQYIDSVRIAIQEMNLPNTPFKKVVLANSRYVSSLISPLEVFIQLTQKYPDGFVYLTKLNSENIWLGASPELLLEETNKDQYKTVSLAGTLGKHQNVWTQKEFEEQQMVTEYITNTLTQKEITVRAEPALEVAVGPLKHLKTEINISSPNHSIFDLAKTLQPTPAINGIPKEGAFEFIQKREPIKRNYYSGIIGLVQPDKKILHVNLRCARVAQNGYVLFAGAGITKDSEAEKEWFETQHKMEIIESLLTRNS